MHTPCLLSQVSTERILTFSMSALSMSRALTSSISSFALASNSFGFCGFRSEHAMLAFAGQHRADFDLLNVRVIDEPGLDLVNLFVRLGEQLLRLLRIRDTITRKAADEAGAQLSHLALAFVDSRDPDAVGRAAILLANNRVLRHILQLAGHVTRVGGLEGGVGQPLAGAVGRDEVLEHREALAEVGENRLIDVEA